MKKIALIILLVQIFSLVSCSLLPNLDISDGPIMGDSGVNDSEGDGDKNIPEEKPDGGEDNSNFNEDAPEVTPDNGCETDDNFIYEIIDDGISIIKYIGDNNFVQIPSQINGFPVVKIASGAFSSEVSSPLARRKMLANDNSPKEDDGEDKNLDLGVYIPEGIKDIDNGAFPEGSVFVSDAKEKNEGWKDESIKGNASSGADDGGNVYFNYDKDDVYVQGGLLFVYNDHQQGYFLTKCLKQKKNIEIPAYVNGKPVVHIGQRAFFENNHIKSVVIPETIAYIWHRAFMYCTSLEQIICNSENLSKILSYSFAECSSLNEVVLPKFVTYLQSGAFENCGTIKKMTVPPSLITVSMGAFNGTTIEEVEYLGTEEVFNDMNISERKNEGFLNAKFSFLPPTDISVLEDLSELKNQEFGSKVQVEGYVSMFASAKYLFLINEDNSYGVQVYYPFYDGELPPRFAKVRITAIWTKYTGQAQLSSIDSIEVLEENAMTALPIQVTIEDFEENPEIYTGRYLMFTGIIHSTASGSTYFVKEDGSRSDVMLYSTTLKDNGEPMQFIATIIRFNNLIEMLRDPHGMNNYEHYFTEQDAN